MNNIHWTSGHISISFEGKCSTCIRCNCLINTEVIELIKIIKNCYNFYESEQGMLEQSSQDSRYAEEGWNSFRGYFNMSEMIDKIMMLQKNRIKSSRAERGSWWTFLYRWFDHSSLNNSGSSPPLNMATATTARFDASSHKAVKRRRRKLLISEYLLFLTRFCFVFTNYWCSEVTILTAAIYSNWFRKIFSYSHCSRNISLQLTTNYLKCSLSQNYHH